MRLQYEEKLRVARQKGQEERNRYRAEASQEERALLESAREDASDIMYKGQKQVEMLREKTVEQLDQEVQKMAKMMAEKILGRSIKT